MRALVQVHGEALVVVVAGMGEHRERVLGQGQQAVLLGRHADAGGGMAVHDAGHLRPAVVNRTMNRKSGRIDAVFARAQEVAVEVDLDQAGGGDLLEQQAEGIDQEMVLWPRHPRRKVGRQKIGPAVVRDQTKRSREIDPDLPFLRCHVLGGRIGK